MDVSFDLLSIGYMSGVCIDIRLVNIMSSYKSRGLFAYFDDDLSTTIDLFWIRVYTHYKEG